ncbi:MAG TPA: prolyl oligopeptidase family serine peptidase, partial [Acidimicrobiales bacterium]|nr:prolyl oligopeptidase family serine peptidase [Acidimicrobiales bacterium]
PETIADTSYGLAWASDNATVFYTRVDDAMRPYQVWRHRLGTDPASDVLVLQEDDQRFVVEPWRTKDGRLVVLSLTSTSTDEAWVVPADRPGTPPHLVVPRRAGVEYDVDHWSCGEGPGWLLAVTNDAAVDFRLLARPATFPIAPAGGEPAGALAADFAGSWVELLAHRPGVRLLGVDVLDAHLVVRERDEGERRVRVVPLGAPGDAPGAVGPFGGDLLAASWTVPADEHPATTWDGPNPQMATPYLRFEQTSLVTPRTVADLDLATRASIVRKRQPVPGYDRHRYRSYRLEASAADGTAVPISVVHRADLLAPGDPDGTPPPSPAPCLLYGYGAYEHAIDPVFSPLRLPLLDRGAIFAVAHVRGGGELGRRWYEEGRLGAKPHTFGDFVACARHLVDTGFTAPDRLAARGASAGGLLVGAVANLAPELFRALVAEVPFVDCLTTMLDDTLPLTVGEWEEWGNPAADAGDYATIASYSPYDNVRSLAPDGTPVRYPDVLATAGLNDNRVGFWEPAKWVARLRAANPQNRALLRVEMGAGHGGPSGRYDAWRDEAFVLAFLLDALGLARSPAGGADDLSQAG